MRRIVLSAVLVFLCAFTAAAQDPAAQDPIEGLWLSVDDKSGAIQSGWELYQDGGLLYGKMLSGIDLSAQDIAVKCKESYKGFPVAGKVNRMPFLGSPWIFGLRMESPGVWLGGNIIDPSNGNMYKCKITHHAADGKKFKTEVMELRGEIGLGIGGSQLWIRATREQIDALH
ncbi:MAG: DUF2147 domain-containing protein [Clostridiales bacterium]|nr:DUF2147 domain-containing protein [Clostridiales bacterium]